MYSLPEALTLISKIWIIYNLKISAESSKVNGDDNCKEQNGIITEEVEEHKNEDKVFVNGDGKEVQQGLCQ